MKALVWHGKNDVRVDSVRDPQLVKDDDVILKVTSTAICGSDLHLLDGYVPEMREGDILGHEFMGEVVEVGKGVRKLKKGDRVVTPFVIACGECAFCSRGEVAFCHNSNPDTDKLKTLNGDGGAGMFGYSHLYGGFAGGQAEYVRVPYANVGPIKIPAHLEDEQVLFLSDIFPTGWMAVENCQLEPGSSVAIWGCGPVGLMAIKSAWLQGARQVIAIDRVPERLALAESDNRTETINFEKEKVFDRLQALTNKQGPDACIDAVGLEAHAWGSVDAVMDKAKASVMLATDRAHALREAIYACRRGGTVSFPGVYAGAIDKMPFGPAFGKGLTFRMGQTHVQRYLPELLKLIEDGEVDLRNIISHTLPLDQAPEAYKMFRDKKDGYTKVVLKP